MVGCIYIDDISGAQVDRYPAGVGITFVIAYVEAE
jgi:hypothetical protein